MIKIQVNENHAFEIDPELGLLNGKAHNADISVIGPGLFHILRNNKSYNAELISSNSEEKTFSVRINGNVYRLQMKDRYDELLHQLGMDSTSAKKVMDLKAPMPGLVLDIRVKEGDVVAKGDTILVLEAMKMENSLKAQSAGTIRKFQVKKGDKVEKGQTLVELSA